jgi:NTE family protein
MNIAVTEKATIAAGRPQLPGQVVLVLQGGGALGAYQVGVYRALSEAGVEPDWVIGTSIGAINASLIAGNAPGERFAAMEEFWNRVEHSDIQRLFSGTPLVGTMLSNWLTLVGGVPPFFRPNTGAFVSLHAPLGADNAGYYSTQPLHETLEELVDFSLVNKGPVRLTVGAANVRTGEMKYFDSRDMPLRAEHVMASGALPPAFPAIRIDGDLYWDGGILSNTPVEAVFDDNPRRDSIVFTVHLWNPGGREPDTIWQVMNRHKDIQYSSRALSHIKRQRQLHRLRHIVKELAMLLPEDLRKGAAVRELESYGCLTKMHVVRLLAPSLKGEDHMKDIDFSRIGIRTRSEAGYRDTMRVLDTRPWERESDPLEGFVLHETAT